MPDLFDTHAHLDFGPFADEAEAVLQRASAAGVAYVTAIGIGRDEQTLGRALSLSRRFPKVFPTVGIHPHDGKYATIRELLTQGEHGGTDGKVDELTEKQIDDLVEFVLSL